MSISNLYELAEKDPLAHPVVTSIRCFEFSHPPGDHLIETYNTLWRATDADFPYAPTRVARLMPRGHAKTEGVAVVYPTWAILSHPDVRVAVISKTKGLAAKRTEKVVNSVERWASHFGITIADKSKTELTTEEGRQHKEPTLSPWGLESNLTGNHFDVIIYDDIVDWDNQRTETQRRNVRNYFRDYVDNLGSNDSILPNGPVQAVIGTRKHPEDLYETDIINSKTWGTEIYRAVHPEDWSVIESRDWTIIGSDGNEYESIGELPPDVRIANNGVYPNQEVRVLWEDQKPANAICYDIVDGDESSLVWQRENQQNPDALTGQVFTPEMLHYVEELPETESGEAKSLTWVAGLDLAKIDDPQKAAEGDGDYFALAVIGIDPDDGAAYLEYLTRKRGMSTKQAKDWVVDHITGNAPESPGFPLSKLLVEQNAGRGIGQRIQSDTRIPAENVSSSGSKEERLHNLAADFESRDLVIHGDPMEEPWRTFETSEWLPFPTGSHDDMLDAIELAMRLVETAGAATGTASTRDEPETSSSNANLDSIVRQSIDSRKNKWK